MANRIDYKKRTNPADLEDFSNYAERTWNEALLYYNDKEGWKVSKEGPNGAVVYAKKNKKGKTIFKLEGAAQLDKDTFYRKFFSIEEAEKMPEWNATMQYVQVLQEVDEGTHVCYQATNSIGPGGIVSGRDFTIIRRMRKIDGKNIVCYGSYDLSDVPPVKNFVRADTFPSVIVVETPPGGDSNQVLLSWVVDMDLKLSLVPTAVFNQIFQYLLLDNMKSVRDRCEKLRTGAEKA